MKLPKMKMWLFNAATPSGMGTTGLYCAAFGAWLSPPLSSAGQLLMLIGLIRLRPSWASLGRDRLLRLSAVYTAYVLMRTLWAGVADPFHWVDHMDQAGDLVRLGFGTVLLPAIWMARDSRCLFRVALLALCGFAIEIGRHADGHQLATLLHSRPGFGMPVNAFGLYCAVALLCLIVLSPRILRHRQSKPFFTISAVLLICGIAAMALGLVISQSRSAWLAIAAGGVLVAMLWWWHCRVRKGTATVNWSQIVVWGLGLVVVCGMVFPFREVVFQRLTTEKQTIEAFLGGVENDNYDSVSSRFYIWHLAVNSLCAKPLFGWGPAGPQILLDEQTSIQVRGYNLRDFHNSYLEVAVQLGMVGCLFWAGFLWMLMTALADAHRKGWLPVDIYLFIAGSVLTFMVSTAFNLRTGDHNGREFVALFGGMAYTFRFRWLHAQTSFEASSKILPVSPGEGPPVA